MSLNSYSQISEQDIRAMQTEEIDLFAKEHERWERYLEYWKLYKGEHWDDTELEEDMPTIKQNKAKVLVNKGLAFLVGKPFTINYLDESVENILAPYVNILLENSGKVGGFGYEAAQMGFVTGDCFIKAVYNEKKKKVFLQIKDSQDVAVKYTFVDYSNNVPDECHIRWKFLDKDGDVKEKREVWTDDKLEVFINGEKQKKESGANILGYVPIVHIKNQLVGKEVYGFSDIGDLEDLNKLLNYSLRRFVNLVDYNIDPVTILYGARVKQMEKGENKLWGNLPKDSRVENLNLNTDLPAMQKMIEYISGALHESGNTSEKSTTGAEHISNTSGVALYMNNLPLMELTARKKIAYGPGFQKAIMMGLDLMARVEAKKWLELEEAEVPVKDRDKHYPFTGIMVAASLLEEAYRKSNNAYIRLKPWNHVDIKFSDFMPKDQLTEMQLVNMELASGLESKRGAMKRLGKDNIDRILAEIQQEAVDQANLEAMALYGQGEQTGEEVPDNSEGMMTQPGGKEVI